MGFEIRTMEGLSFIGVSESSILDSALGHNFVFEYSCKNGQCGICKTTLLAGNVIELQPQIGLSISDIEDKKILTCCCEPNSDILIDAENLSALRGVEVKTSPARINQINFLSEHIVEIILRLPPSAQFKFLEGQYLDVIHSVATRSYSIASSSNQSEIKLLIKKVENGLLSSYWFDGAKHNDLLRIEGPKGTFFLRDKSKPLIFLATGTGIAPIMAILQQLENDLSFQQLTPIYLFWGNRCDEDFVWNPIFHRIKVETYFVHSKPGAFWRGERGYVQDVALNKVLHLQKSHVYACGSNNMIISAKRVFFNAGLDEKNFYSDAFVQSY